MKKFITFILLLTLGIAGYSKTLQVYISYAAFNTPNNKPYLETYMSVIGNSVAFAKTDNNTFQGAVEVTLTFSKLGELVYADKYRLNGPEVTDTSLVLKNFLDQQRIPLKNGTYTMAIEIADANNPSQNYSVSEEVTIDFPADKMSFSDIEMIDSYSKTVQPSILSKSGYDLVPLVPFGEYFYPNEMKSITFYSEIYNSTSILGDSGKFLVNYYLEVANSEKKIDQFSILKKYSTSPVGIVFAKFNIEELPSGDYNLVIEARDRNDKVIAKKKTYFFRSNPDYTTNITIDDIAVKNSFVDKYNNVEELKEYINSLWPISDDSEREIAEAEVEKADLGSMKAYFLRFWKGQNAFEPEKEWNKYKENVDIVNKKYGNNIRKGYLTDRGRVYLQYGKPTLVEARRNEPNAYPYEIWQFDFAQNKRTQIPQNNIIFIFVNQELSTNTYRLIHSDAIGEVINERWRIVLQKRTQTNENLDNNGSDTDNFGNRFNSNSIID